MYETLLELIHDEIEEIVEEKKELGRQQGLAEGLQLFLPELIKTYKHLNLSETEVLDKLTTELNLSEDTVMEYMEKYMPKKKG